MISKKWSVATMDKYLKGALGSPGILANLLGLRRNLARLLSDESFNRPTKSSDLEGNRIALIGACIEYFLSVVESIATLGFEYSRRATSLRLDMHG